MTMNIEVEWIHWYITVWYKTVEGYGFGVYTYAIVPLKVAIIAAYFLLEQVLVPIAVKDKNMRRLPIR